MERLIAAGAVSVGALALLLLAAWLYRRLQRLPYGKVRSLLSPAEMAFYGVLLRSIDGDLSLFAKVRLADILTVRRGTPNRQEHVNRIIAKHLDFVLCDSRTLAPLLAIELDDASHELPSRRRRDAFLDRALAAAGLPLLRVTARAAYSPADLAGRIRDAMR